LDHLAICKLPTNALEAKDEWVVGGWSWMVVETNRTAIVRKVPVRHFYLTFISLFISFAAWSNTCIGFFAGHLVLEWMGIGIGIHLESTLATEPFSIQSNVTFVFSMSFRLPVQLGVYMCVGVV